MSMELKAVIYYEVGVYGYSCKDMFAAVPSIYFSDTIPVLGDREVTVFRRCC